MLNRKLLTVAEFIRQAVEACRPLMDSQGQQLVMDIGDEPICVNGDLVRLTQVMTNLLNNASKYTQRGGVITLSARVSDTGVELRVLDNGSGIPAATLPHIFDLFVQSDRALARAQGGLGIGLTVVRRLVEMHGGTVTAYSAGLNQGSEFVVRLPLLDDVPCPGVDHAELRPPHRNGYRIAVIEDNVDANDSIRTLLQMMGNDVSCAFDGLSGVELVKSSVPQVVLCDIGLPGLDGYGVVSRLRDEMDEPLPCMVALTGYGQPEDRANALAAGFDFHLVKPVNLETLMHIVAQYFDPAVEGRVPVV